MNQLYPTQERPFSTALMCCDRNGLCLKKKGDIDSSHAGTYTAIMRMASQLDGTGIPSSPTSTTRTRAAVTVSVDTNQSATIIKQYDGHTVIMKVPVSRSGDPTDSGEAEMAGDSYRTSAGNEDADLQQDGVGKD